MKELKDNMTNVRDRLLRNLHWAIAAVALVLFAFSFSSQSYQMRLDKEVRTVQKSLHKRQKIIEEYALRAIQSDDQWVTFSDLPDDMVVYCYHGDTLKSWTHQFPIGNDDIRDHSLIYRLQSNDGRNMYSAPLAYMDVKEQYANLGSAWYIVNTQISRDFDKKIVTGILVRTDYPGNYLENKVNRKLHIGSGFTTIGVNNDDSAIVYGREGEPLFSIVSAAPSSYASSGSPLAWVSFLLIIVAAFLFHYRKRNGSSFLVVFGTLVAVRIVSALYILHLGNPGDIFSPIYYADNNLFNSLGNLLINNALLSLLLYAAFNLRHRLLRRMEQDERLPRKLYLILSAAAAAGLIIYIYGTLKSLVVNSNITLEPFRIGELSWYSLLCFFSYAMLALSLLMILQFMVSCTGRWRHLKLFTWRNATIYVLVFSAFCVATISINGLNREVETNRVRTEKLAVERDLNLELSLIDIDQQIAYDSFISVLSSVKAMELIRNRLLDRYFSSEIIRKYNIEITLCTPDNLLDLMTGAEPVGCFQFYDDLVVDNGTPLYDGSDFYFINSYDGKTTYLGVFTYIQSSDNAVSRLFIKLESKYQNATAGTPMEQLGIQTPRAGFLPKSYSYAKYVNGRLVNHDGPFTYPMTPPEYYRQGYGTVKSDGYLHFVNKISEESIVVVSRRNQSLFSYLISFSYLSIFFGAFILLAMRWNRSGRLIHFPKRSLARRITFVVTGAMIVALLSMGIGSVVYVIKVNKNNFDEVTETRISAVEDALSSHCKYALRYNQVVTPEMLAAVNEVASIYKCDINLFDTDGMLLVSTKPELYEQFIVGKRMNNEAYDAVVRNKESRFTMVESMAGVSYYNLYAPLLNADGETVAIVSVPYTSRNNDLNEAAVTTISTIINLYLLLLIAAVILGYILSNSVVRPIAEIRNKLDRLALPGNRNRHIKYRNTRDEIGVLIETYNKMVDDLEESTNRLAQQEREQAWKEMARQIAHEIKNPLTPMRLSIQYLMRLKAENVPGWEDRLDKISHSLLEQIDTLTNTANEFSSFSKFFSEEISDVDVDKLIREQAVLFDNRDNISIRYLQNVENPVVKIRRNQLSRVFVNLITNSIQAMENSGQEIGHIKITLDRVEVEGELMYSVAVEDNGPGVKDENLSKLFTPNFTTKTSGTGLGLAICRNILEQSGGSISYSRSTLGGACFTILLKA